MAHYALLDENNIVVEVITGIDETELIEGLDPETWYGNFKGLKCKRTSYNGNIRKNYAGKSFTYDESRNDLSMGTTDCKARKWRALLLERTRFELGLACIRITQLNA